MEMIGLNTTSCEKGEIIDNMGVFSENHRNIIDEHIDRKHKEKENTQEFDKKAKDACNYALNYIMSAVSELPTLTKGKCKTSIEIRITWGWPSNQHQYYITTSGDYYYEYEKKSIWSGRKETQRKRCSAEQFKNDIQNRIESKYFRLGTDIWNSDELGWINVFVFHMKSMGDGGYSQIRGIKKREEIEESIKDYFIATIQSNIK